MCILRVGILKNCIESKSSIHSNYVYNKKRGDAATWIP